MTARPSTESARPGSAFVQELRVSEGDRLLASARWHTSGDPAEGVAQILDLQVEPSARRRGHGTRLVRRIVDEAHGLFRAQRRRLRRVWIAVEQKQQVQARAFLTHLGFHHTATVKNLLRDEDMLIYSKAYD